MCLQTGGMAASQLIPLTGYTDAIRTLMQLPSDEETRVFLATDDQSVEKEIVAAFSEGESASDGACLPACQDHEE